MKGIVVLTVLALVGCISAQNADTSRQMRQKRDQFYLTTPSATTESPISTTISLSPQTSISVHHSIVRNKPAYPYSYTESTLQTDGTEDTSYYYTYEDISEDSSKPVTSSVSSVKPSTKPTVRSFWNSQKALLDARRKENSQKFMPTYSKPSSSSKENKPTVEFKVREKPKFGLANKNKQFTTTTTTTTKKPEVTTTKPAESSTVNKVVKSDIQLNLPIKNMSEKDILKALKDTNLLPNQIIGRVGEMPMQSNLASQLQSQLKAQSSNINTFGSANPSKFDSSLKNVQFVDNAKSSQQPSLADIQKQAALLSNLRSQIEANLNQQRSANTQAQPSSIQSLLNLNQNQQPNLPPGNAFIAASIPESTSGRSADLNVQAAPQTTGSSLLQRLGALGLGGNSADGASIGRDGGYGGGGNNGFTLNLGPVPDPLSFILRLLSLIPRPLLDLNGRIFFGIELGKNAGLVSGSGGAKPYSG